MNQYAYALGNPVNGSDRSGLDWADCRDGTGDTCWYDDDTHYNSYVEVVEYYDAREDLRHLAEGPIDLLTRKIWLANSARNQLRKEMQADIDEQDRAAAETTVTSDGAASSAEAAAAGVQAGRDMLVGQLDNLATRFKEYLFDGVDPCKTGYVDVNFTFSPGVVGPTAGIQITKNGVHVYGGVNGGTPNVSVGISGSLQDPSPGLNGAVSGASSPGVSSNWQAGYGPIGTGTGSVLWRAERCLGRPGSICPAALR